MKTTGRRAKITVSADGSGIVSGAGGLLLVQTARLAGLNQGLSAVLSRWRAIRAVHDPGKIIADLVVALALGGTAWLMWRRCERSRNCLGRWPPIRWCPG